MNSKLLLTLSLAFLLIIVMGGIGTLAIMGINGMFSELDIIMFKWIGFGIPFFMLKNKIGRVIKNKDAYHIMLGYFGIIGISLIAFNGGIA